MDREKLISDVAKKDNTSIHMKCLELCRDDFIEWILHYTNEEMEFRVNITEHYILVGIDKLPFIP